MNPNAKEAIFFMSKVKVIPVHPKYLVKRYTKVAAYCRVSTEQERQYYSLEAQREHFENTYRNGNGGYSFEYTQTKHPGGRISR